MPKRRMLLAFAHPDDETFGMGGTIAKYVDEGAEVYLVCTTNGDVGTVPEDMADQYDDIADLRLGELNCAAEKLGFQQVINLGYKDSGMMGTDSTQDPECSWYVWQHHPQKMIRQIVEAIRQVRPQVVVTFNPYGGYGHPDHIAVHEATVAAFEKAGDPEYRTDGTAPYQPQKLYFTNIPTFILRLGILLMRLRGKDPHRMGINKDIDLVAILDHVEPTHTNVDISRYLKAWDEANACHASQGGGSNGFIPFWLRRLLGSKQGFTRAHPKPVQDKVDEFDLFAGIE